MKNPFMLICNITYIYYNDKKDFVNIKKSYGFFNLIVDPAYIIWLTN